MDRSSEIQETLVAKAGCYLDYYRRGGFAVRNGATRDDYKKFPFRVLMVFKTAERRNNTAERLLQNTPPILTLVYLSTFEEVTRDPTGAIWIRPLDYREATKGTPFAPEKQPKTWGYKRQTARELFVEQKVTKAAHPCGRASEMITVISVAIFDKLDEIAVLKRLDFLPKPTSELAARKIPARPSQPLQLHELARASSPETRC